MRPIALSLLFLLATAAQASTPIDQTRPLDPRGKVEVQNVKGRIQVRAWDRPEVQIRGSLGEGVEKLEIDGDRGSLEIRVRYPRNGGWGGKSSEPSELLLMVPLRASLDLHAVSADVDVSGVAPDSLSIESVSGQVTVAAAPGALSVESVSGDVTVTANSPEVSINTVSGGVDLRGRLDGKVEAETVSGSIRVAVKDQALRDLSTNSVSGDTRVSTALARNGKLSLSSVSGGLLVVLPRAVSAHVTAESFSGTLRAPDATIERPRHGPGSSLDARYGSGEGEVTLETFSGDAELRLE